MQKRVKGRIAALAFAVSVSSFIGLYCATRTIACEDAHILFRVARNLAETGVPYWGRIPATEAATEWLWMMVLSFVHFIGADIPTAAQWLGVAAMLGVSFALYRKYRLFPIIIACPAVVWASSGLGTALFSLLLVLFMLDLDGNRYRAAAWGALALLTRAEAAPLLIVLLLMRNRDLRAPAAMLGVLAVYWAWRTWYFGSLLPNTWLAKSAFSFQLVGLKATLYWLAFSVPLAFIARDRRAAFVIAAFPLLYLLSGQEMNIGMRFQFAYLPMLAALVEFPTKRKQAAAFVLWLVPSVALSVSWVLDWQLKPDERVLIGNRLAMRSGTALVTEAGWLPYYSRWTCLDAVGIADDSVRIYGADTARLYAYYDRHSPDLIMWHCYDGKPENVAAIQRGQRVAWSGDKNWSRVLDRISGYATSRRYRVMGISGEQWDCRYYLVRRKK